VALSILRPNATQPVPADLFIYRALAAGNLQRIAKLPGSTTFFVDTNLAANTTLCVILFRFSNA
jgi:hypothetical protein